MSTTDKYGEGNFDLVPSGPHKGKPWAEIPALTLNAVLVAVALELVELDDRRVAAIRAALAAKDGGAS